MAPPIIGGAYSTVTDPTNWLSGPLILRRCTLVQSSG